MHEYFSFENFYIINKKKMNRFSVCLTCHTLDMINQKVKQKENPSEISNSEGKKRMIQKKEIMEY